jgi:hypothetical protein
MPKRRYPCLDEIFSMGSYSFLVLDFTFANARDLPGLMRYRLESVLPRGIEGLGYFFRQIGRSRRFLVTLIKKPIPDSTNLVRIALPFPLHIPERGIRVIQWHSYTADYNARYEEGLLATVASVPNGQDVDADSSCIERRDAITPGPSVQQPIGHGDKIWRIAVVALIIALMAQLSFAAKQAMGSREARLNSLNEQLSILSKFSASETKQAATAHDTGLQTHADRIQKSVSRRWKTGYSLAKWSLSNRVLRLEGWGPDALVLLSSLRADPLLAGLELASRTSEDGYDVYIFEGEVDIE